jgi:hypothetical protein
MSTELTLLATINQSTLTPARSAAYRRLAVAILGLDVLTMTRELEMSIARQRQVESRAA